MAKLTISLRKDIYKKIIHHTEINWERFVNTQIQKEIERIEEDKGLMMLSMKSFEKDWDNEYDKRWDDCL